MVVQDNTFGAVRNESFNDSGIVADSSGHADTYDGDNIVTVSNMSFEFEDDLSHFPRQGKITSLVSDCFGRRLTGS